MEKIDKTCLQSVHKRGIPSVGKNKHSVKIKQLAKIKFGLNIC